MTARRNNLVLIGMPGSGKSTVGVLLAKALAFGFVDTDLLIQSDQGRTLQDIVDQDGYLALRPIEEQILCRLTGQRQVISTGGSAVYSDAAMTHLRSLGVVVFLDIRLTTVRKRLGDYSLRGISKRPDQTLEALFRERHRLYSRAAEIVVSGDGRNQDEVCQAVLAALPATFNQGARE
ncbi:shikimate kinase [Marinobacter sp. SS21]|uniref:shikimate kinase n=1 Tax=Marinobacter sp. SS21 TaxID=2979460 RepID=UPI00232F8B45|nr:shikimate kinase [Marinobacter sp. SS21]MDC0661543.1 shikimate kinase [Marinobacter sp. SS21]